jgi:hypothetical protein
VTVLAVAEGEDPAQLAQGLLAPALDGVQSRRLDEVGGVVAAEAARLRCGLAEPSRGTSQEVGGLPLGSAILRRAVGE